MYMSVVLWGLSALKLVQVMQADGYDTIMVLFISFAADIL